MRKLAILLVVLSFGALAAPASADPQWGIFYGKYDSWTRPALLGVVHVPLLEFGRLGVGPCGGLGAVFDNDDRNRYGSTHAHLAAAACGAVNYRLRATSTWHVVGGYGHAWVFPASARNHAPNFNFFMVGLTKEF
jgi:hypothetical protein